jgi:hypothetical protein
MGFPPVGRFRQDSSSSSNSAAARLTCALLTSRPHSSSDGGDLALDVQLGHRQLERSFAPLPAFQHSGVELDPAGLGNLKLERPQPALDRLGLEAVAVAALLLARWQSNAPRAWRRWSFIASLKSI